GVVWPAVRLFGRPPVGVDLPELVGRYGICFGSHDASSFRSLSHRATNRSRRTTAKREMTRSRSSSHATLTRSCRLTPPAPPAEPSSHARGPAMPGAACLSDPSRLCPRGDSRARAPYFTTQGFAFQMSAAYSAMVRSLENLPDPATLRMAFRAQPSGSAYSAPSRSLAS